MLARRDLERIANAQDVELRVVEHDYVITHILAQVRPTAGDVLVFKGGTCLRKVYFEDYRYSEDLDFSLSDPGEDSAAVLAEVLGAAAAASGIELQASGAAVATDGDLADRVTYRGPLGGTNTLKIDITGSLEVSDDPQMQFLLSSFQDAPERASIVCYTIQDICIDKVLCLLSPHRQEPRDVYDLVELLRDPRVVNDWLHAQTETRAAGRNLHLIDLEGVLDRQRSTYRDRWHDRLSRQFREPPEFEEYWRALRRELRAARLI